MTDTQERHAQLQEQMTVCLDSLRRKVAVQMEAAYDDLSRLPKIKGENTPTLAGDRRMNRDESGGVVAMMVADAGVGMSAAARIGGGVASELYGSREATRARPQDKTSYSFAELKKIRREKAKIMARLSDLGDKIDLLDTYKSCGVSRVILMTDGTLEALHNAPGAALKAKAKKQEQGYTPAAARRKPPSFGLAA